MSAAVPNPKRQAHRAELASRAYTEALSLAGADPDPGPGRPPLGELTAEALRAHSALSAALGRTVPVTGLGPGGGVRGLATFLAVYAAQYEQQDAPDLGSAA